MPKAKVTDPKRSGAAAEPFAFTAEQVGSEILERFSSDIYTPRAIIRELVKNAHDSYIELETYAAEENLAIDEPDDAPEPFSVFVDVAQDSITIRDYGIGLDKAGFHKLVSIALTEKRDLDGVTGFRGIGFWSAYMAGDSITIASSKIGDNRRYTLRLMTKRMREKQGPSVSLHEIMNDRACMSLTSEAASEAEHGTTIRIAAPSKENSLKPLIENPEDLKTQLLASCSCQLSEDSEHREAIETIYSKQHIKLTRLFFNGDELFRRLPSGLGPISEHTFHVTDAKGKKRAVAHMWYATNKKNQKLTPGGIRIVREGFPVGAPNLYSGPGEGEGRVTRADILNWHAGDVILTDDLLRPDAGGDRLRESPVLRAFITELRTFYEDDLVVVGRAKQLRASKRKEYEKAARTVQECSLLLKKGKTLDTQQREEIQKAEKLVRDHDELAKGKAPPGKPTVRARIVRDEEVKTARNSLAKALSDFKQAGGAVSEPAPSPPRASTQASKASESPRILASRSDLLTFVDEVRDLAEEVLTDDEEMKDEFLKGFDLIVGRYVAQP